MPKDVVSHALRLARGHIEEAASRAHPDPTPGQASAGNYQKGHLTIQGLPITIETAKGSYRRGVGKDGKAWKSRSPAQYGYIKRTTGSDGDHVDCYIGTHPFSQTVWIVDQVDGARFDEHKAMIGFRSEQEALDTYRKGFSDGKGHERIGHVTKLSIPQFKAWLKHGDTTRPAGSVEHLADGGVASDSARDNPAGDDRKHPSAKYADSYPDGPPSTGVNPKHYLPAEPQAELFKRMPHGNEFDTSSDSPLAGLDALDRWVRPDTDMRKDFRDHMYGEGLRDNLWGHPEIQPLMPARPPPEEMGPDMLRKDDPYTRLADGGSPNDDVGVSRYSDIPIGGDNVPEAVSRIASAYWREGGPVFARYGGRL